MSNLTEERIIEHDTYIKLSYAIEIVNSLTNFNEYPLEDIEKLGRIQEVLSLLKDILDRADPSLVSLISLKNANQHIVNIYTELRQFQNDYNSGRLLNASNYIDNLIPFFPQFQIIQTPKDIEGVRESVVRFRQSIGQYLKYLDRDIEESKSAFQENKDALEVLKSSIDNEKTRIDTMVTDFQAKFLKGQEERNDKSAQLHEEFKGNFEDLIDESESTFKNFAEEHKSKFENQFNIQAANFEDQQNENRVLFIELFNDLETKMKEEIEKIEKMNEEAKSILGTMSINGLANGYKEIADKERISALVWNVISVLSLVGLLAVGIQFIISQGTGMTWVTLTSRLIITGIGLTLFTYGAKQAGNHRTEESRNRKIQVELASLNPYLVDLEESKQKEVKEALAHRYFGAEPQANTSQNTQPSQIKQQDILSAMQSNPAIIQAITDLVIKQNSTLKP